MEEMSGTDKIKLGTMYGERLLNAVEKGDIKTVKEIVSLPLEKGGPKLLCLIGEDKEGNSALHLAVAGGYKKIVLYLLEQGLRGNWKNNDGKTPKDFAIEKDYQEILGLIQKYKFPSREIVWMEYEYATVKYDNYIEMYGTDNWMCWATCHNPKCGYKSDSEELRCGISGMHPSLYGFLVPALCRKCKAVVSVGLHDCSCPKCGGKVKPLPPYPTYSEKGLPAESEANLICPKCGQKTMQLQTINGTWD